MLRSVRADTNEVVGGIFADTVTLRCFIKDVPSNGVVDSGAGPSLMTNGMFRKIPNGKLSPADKTLKDASHNNIKLLGKVTLPVKIRSNNGKLLIRNVEFFVSDCDDVSCALLGRNFMSQFGTVSFDFDNNRIQLGETMCSGFKTFGGRAKISDQTTVPAKSESLIKLKSRKGNGLVKADFLPDTFNGNPGLYAMKARVLPDTNGNFFVMVVNTTDKDIVLKKSGRLGKLHPCAETIAEVNFEGDDKNPIDWSKANIGAIPETDRAKVLNLLQEYEDVFAKNTKRPKQVNNATHSIDTGGCLPVFRKPYPIP